MTKEEEFIDYYSYKQKNCTEIEDIMKISAKRRKELEKNTKKEREKIQNISNRYSSIKSRVKTLKWERKGFLIWWRDEPKECNYCKTSEEDIENYYHLVDSKRSKTRGKSLEVDRREDTEYSEKNCVLACYWCNNAKSDVFSAEEFMPIAKQIGITIQNKIKSSKKQHGI